MFLNQVFPLDNVRVYSSRTVILPGEQEPLALRQRAEYARLCAQDRAEARALASVERDRARLRLVRRLRSVLARV